MCSFLGSLRCWLKVPFLARRNARRAKRHPGRQWGRLVVLLEAPTESRCVLVGELSRRQPKLVFATHRDTRHCALTVATSPRRPGELTPKCANRRRFADVKFVKLFAI